MAVSNVREGARIAAGLAPDLVLFDGSGAAIPPVETSRRILVVNSASDPEVATGYLNEYRHLVSDLVILTMAEPGTGWEELHRRALALAPAVVATTLRPRPTADIAGRKVAFFSAAPESAHAIFAAHLRRSTAPTSSTSRARSPTARRCAPSWMTSTRRSSSSS